MDRRTTLAIVLFVSIYYVWMTVRGVAEPEPEPAPDSAEVPAEAEPAPVAPAAIEDDDPTPESEAPFAGCGIDGRWVNAGGLRAAALPDHEGPLQVQPLYGWLYDQVAGAGGPWKPWGDPPGPEVVLSAEARALAVGVGAWGQAPAALDVVSSTPEALTLRGRRDGVRVDQVVRPVTTDGVCVLEVEVTWTNERSAPYDAGLWVGVHDRVDPPAGGMFAGYDSRKQPLLHVADDLAYGDPDGGMVGGCMGYGAEAPASPGAPVAIDGVVDWFGVADRYFGFLVVPDTEGGVGHFSTVSRAGDPLAGAHLVYPNPLAPGASHTARLRAYAGPLDGKVLDRIHPTLSDAVDLGFFAFFGYPLLWLLRFFEGLVGNWGVAIVLLTVTVKAAFFPMTQSSFRSMQKMQQIQPEMNRIREEHADNPAELNRLTMELMAREKVNPLSGCLPMVVQMPVWFALYQVLLTSVDLYHTDFLWLRDLSAPDPYCILPLAVMAMMAVQQQFTNTANMDPAQARVMKVMPVLFGAFFFTFPSGLAVYVFVNVLLSILQQWWIKRSMGEAPTIPVM